MVLRWTAAGMMEAAKGFRRLKAHKQLPILKAAALAAHQAKQETKPKLERTESRIASSTGNESTASSTECLPAAILGPTQGWDRREAVVRVAFGERLDGEMVHAPDGHDRVPVNMNEDPQHRRAGLIGKPNLRQPFGGGQ